MESTPRFSHRIGPDPHAHGDTPAAQGCPDIWELENGDFAVIGIRAAPKLHATLPPTASWR